MLRLVSLLPIRAQAFAAAVHRAVLPLLLQALGAYRQLHPVALDPIADSARLRDPHDGMPDPSDAERVPWRRGVPARNLERDVERVPGETSEAERHGVPLLPRLRHGEPVEGAHELEASTEDRRRGDDREIDDVHVAVVHEDDVFCDQGHADDAVFPEVAGVLTPRAARNMRWKLVDVLCRVGDLAPVVVVREAEANAREASGI